MVLIAKRADFEKLDLSLAEEELIKCCEAGEVCSLEDGKLPPEGAPTPERRIRAELLRYLILGGCEDCKVEGAGVRLAGAYITGQLDLSFQTAKGITGLYTCRFEQGVEALQAEFSFLNLLGSALPSLNAQGAKATGNVFLNKISATGEVSLSSAQIGGQLSCEGANFLATTGDALNAEGAEVKGYVFLRNMTAKGTVNLSVAQIGGQLSCKGAIFLATEEHALNAQGVDVKDGVFLRNMTAKGAVTLSGAQIGGQLSCNESRFEATTGDALNAQGADVKGDIFLRSMTAKGTVHLSGARIGGQLSCRDARFEATMGDALNAQGADVKDGVFLRNVTAKGAVTLSGAQIGGQLDREGAHFENSGGRALNAQRLSVAEGLFWRDVKVASGTVDLTAAHVGDLADHLLSWPEAVQLHLEGFTYERIAGSDLDVKARIAWAASGATSSVGFTPQPFTQLAKFYRETGHDSSAREVLYHRDGLVRQHARAERRKAVRGEPSNYVTALFMDMVEGGRIIGDTLLRYVVGYGHKPFNSLFILIALIILAVIPTHYAWEEGSFAPNSGPILVSDDWQAFAALPDDQNPADLWGQDGAPGQDWETFNRYAYAADIVIPIIEFGQTDAWAPSTTRGLWGWHLWWARWLFTVSGWLVTALGAAAITGIIRRE